MAVLGFQVDVYRNAYVSSGSEGLTSKVNSVVLIGAGLPEMHEPTEQCPALILYRKKLHDGTYYYYCEPITDPDTGFRGWMAGGNYVFCNDSRFRQITGYPIPVHDRQERMENWRSQ